MAHLPPPLTISIKLCSSLNSLNWLVWSQSHYSTFFFSVTSHYGCVRFFTGCCWCSSVLLLCVCAFLSKILIFLLNILLGCCFCWYYCWYFDEKRYFTQCLTETCNQQLRTTETTNKACIVWNEWEGKELILSSAYEALSTVYFIYSPPFFFISGIWDKHVDVMRRKKILLLFLHSVSF